MRYIIYFRKEEEKDPDEIYYDEFKSKKGYSADVLNSIIGKKLNLADLTSIEGIKKIAKNLKTRSELYDQR